MAIPAWGEMLVSLRPFASRHALLQAARKAMANWGEDELNAALSAHPRIGEKPTGGQAHAALSRRSSRRWTARMSGSRRPCGGECPLRSPLWPGVLIRAKGRSGDEMLQALTRRLQHTADEEVAEALAQLREITMLRLEGVIGE